MAIRKCALFLLLALLVLLTSQAIVTKHDDPFSWDVDVAEWVQNADAGSIGSYNNRMGVAGAAGVLGLIVIVWLWFKGWRAEAVFVGLVGVADLLNPLFRETIGSPRPTAELITIYRIPVDFSFPSGTAMHVVMFSGFLIYLSMRMMKAGWLRNVICGILGLWIPIMGVWVVYQGRHWPSDALGGFVYGAIFLWIIIWGYQKYITWRRSFPKEQIPLGNLPSLLHPFAWIARIVY